MIAHQLAQHITLVTQHKINVAKNCFRVGLIRQGITHDLSKFSPTELIESARFYTGKSSPINEARIHQGHSRAWLHHKAKNKHHYEYWIDDFDTGGHPTQMPFNYALEMLCDCIGAAQTYQKDTFSYQGELEWWLDKREDKRAFMHPQTKRFLDIMFQSLADTNGATLTRSCAEYAYQLACEDTDHLQ